jgi:multidrug efflux pump subunit AcrA (membrane-fusion protein)
MAGTYSPEMFDLSEKSATKVKEVPVPASPTFSSPPPAFPPPNPSDNSDGRRLTILGIVAVLALVLAVGMGLLWMSANSATGDAEAARDIADAQASANGQANLEAELATARADLDAAQASTDALTAERESAVSELEAGADDLAQLRTQAGDLSVENVQLADEIATLRQELDSAQTEVGEMSIDPTTTPAPISPDVASFDITANPDFARYIGETLSSRRGSSRLGQMQSECFGTALVNDIGLDGLGKGLTLAASAAENNVVVGAMQRAAGTCNIDLSLIF